MKLDYSIPTILRALIATGLGAAGAASTAAGGPDLSVLDLGQWLASIGTGLIAGGALLHPTGKESVNSQAITSVLDVVTKTAEAHDKLTQTAVDSIAAVQKSAGDLTALLPGPIGQLAEAVGRPLGPLTQQVLNALPKVI